MNSSRLAPVSSIPAMAEYGVGGPAWEALPWQWAADRLTAARNYWLVTVSGAGVPHALPVWGVWDDQEFRFAFSCAPGSRKAANLSENPKVVIAPEDTVECVSVQGSAAAVSQEDRVACWIETYLAKYQPHSSDLSAEFLRSNLLFEVTPRGAIGIIERDDEFADRVTKWRFQR